MGIMKSIFKELKKELKRELKASIDNKPKRKNKNLNKIQIQHIKYFRKKPTFKYISFCRINFNNPYLKNITF